MYIQKMKICAILYILIFVAENTLGDTQNVCEEKTTFYDDLACKPAFENIDDSCPHHFDCSQFDNRPKDKCHLKGVYYNEGDMIPMNVTEANCYAACKCLNQDGDLNIVCADIECAEWMDPPPNNGCTYKYDVNKCCAIGTICPDQENLVTCQMGNKTYIEGSRYFSLTRQETCVCSKDKEGKPFNNCRKNSCMIEIYFKKEFENYCAPVYVSNFNVCPADMFCPSQMDEHKYLRNKSLESNVKCRFGSELWNIGDSIIEEIYENGNFEKFECRCTIPPYLTCYRNF